MGGRVLLLFAAGVLGCQSTETDSGPCESEVNHAGLEYQYVVTRVELPEDSDAFATELSPLELSPANAFGGLLAELRQIAPALDLQGASQASLEAGESIALIRVVASHLTIATGVGLWHLEGAAPAVAPCSGSDCGRHLDPGTRFEVAQEADEYPLIGQIVGSRFQSRLGNTTFDLAYLPEAAPLRLELFAVRERIDTVSAERLEGIQLFGGLDAVGLARFTAQLLDWTNARAASGCDASCNCADRTTASLLSALDQNGDCSILSQELRASSLGPWLALNADILDESGEPAIEPDGIEDHWMIGVQMNAVEADFPAIDFDPCAP